MSLWLAWLLSTWLYLLFVISLQVYEHWIMKFSWWIMMWASRHPTCSVCNTYWTALHLHRNFGCCILQFLAFSCLQVGLTLTSDRSCWWCWLLMPAARCQCCSGGRHSWVLQLGEGVNAACKGTVGKSEVDGKWKSSNIGIQSISSEVGVFKMVATCKLTDCKILGSMTARHCTTLKKLQQCWCFEFNRCD